MVLRKLYREGHSEKHINFFVDSMAFQKSFLSAYDQVFFTAERAADQIVQTFNNVKWQICPRSLMS